MIKYNFFLNSPFFQKAIFPNRNGIYSYFLQTLKNACWLSFQLRTNNWKENRSKFHDLLQYKLSIWQLHAISSNKRQDSAQDIPTLTGIFLQIFLCYTSTAYSWNCHGEVQHSLSEICVFLIYIKLFSRLVASSVKLL